MAVKICLKQCVAKLDAGLAYGAFLFFGCSAQAQGAIEILYDHADSTTQRDLAWWWLISVVLMLGLGLVFWLYLKTRRSLLEKEHALERTAERLHEAQNIARIGSWERDFESGETFWSAEAMEVLGLAKDVSKLRHYEALVHPEDVEYVTETIASAYVKGGSYQCDHRVINTDGSEKYIRLAGKVFLGGGNSPVRETGTVQDITERKLAELALQVSERRLRSILEAVPYPIIIVDAGNQHAILYSNDGARALFGFKLLSEIEEFDSRALWKEPDAYSELLAALGQHQRMLKMEMIDSRGNAFSALVTANNMEFVGIQSILLSIVNVAERKQIEPDLERLATLDSLTGVLNRRSFFHYAQKECRRAQRYSQPFALLVMDVDSLDSINEDYGHEFGGQVLKRFCTLTRSVLREEDILGRIGGEEFCVLLVASDHESSRLTAERIRRNWQKESFHLQEESLSYTVSIGVALQLREDETLMQILERADRCLYKAKKAGRNQVVLSSDPVVNTGTER